MAKQGPRRLKIGVQTRGPNSTAELEAVFRKKFGVAYCTVLIEIKIKLQQCAIKVFKSKWIKIKRMFWV